ncbi:hypothetical protein DN824_20450 [Stutzerimonas nosocomialis]|uniref:hypothetical protein n=1 Tax=Stutzerimonas nosocomialis TaxID=1056496 RepID=UPI001109B685|nr:hypothetical protein [Stutzerimonas nosocomialis]TLX54856.1 hypothetical protein DN824_20450 [Stutzerimonas nosocomialis]
MTVRRPLVLAGGRIRQLPPGDSLEAAQAFVTPTAVTVTANGQTSFDVGPYTPGAIMVALNGAALSPGDYTATDGATVVLASGQGVVPGAELLVWKFSPFEVADALPLGGTAVDAHKLGGLPASSYATQADLAGVTPGPEYYRRGNIVGQVSEADGMPTGALVEHGVNANGEYWRYAGGMQLCTYVGDVSLQVTNSYGPGAYGALGWTYPAAFADNPAVGASARTAANLLASEPLDLPGSDMTHACSWAFVDQANTRYTGLARVTFTAIGRWHE